MKTLSLLNLGIIGALISACGGGAQGPQTRYSSSAQDSRIASDPQTDKPADVPNDEGITGLAGGQTSGLPLSRIYEVRVNGTLIPTHELTKSVQGAGVWGDTHIAKVFLSSQDTDISVSIRRKAGGDFQAHRIMPPLTSTFDQASKSVRFSGTAASLVGRKFVIQAQVGNAAENELRSRYQHGVLYLMFDAPNVTPPPGTNVVRLSGSGSLPDMIDSAFAQGKNTVVIANQLWDINRPIQIHNKAGKTLYFEAGAYVRRKSGKIALDIDRSNDIRIHGHGVIEASQVAVVSTNTVGLSVKDLTFINSYCQYSNSRPTGFFVNFWGGKSTALNNIKTFMYPPLEKNGRSGNGHKCGAGSVVFNGNQDLTLENSLIDSHEDGLAIKSFVWTGVAPNRQQLHLQRASTGYNIKGNILYGGIDIGTELDMVASAQKVSGIKFTDNFVVKGQFGINSRDQRTEMTDIVFKNNTIQAHIAPHYFRISSNLTAVGSASAIGSVKAQKVDVKVCGLKVMSTHDYGMVIVGEGADVNSAKYTRLRMDGVAVRGTPVAARQQVNVIRNALVSFGADACQ